MSTAPHKHELFNDSGCLSTYALEHYLKQMLPENDRKTVEGHLATCLLCKDALEGISTLGDSLEENTARVNMRLRNRFGYYPSRRRSQRKGTSMMNFLIPAAASIIILVGIISYFHYFFPERQQLAVAENEEIPITTQKKESIDETLSESPSTFVGGVFDREAKADSDKAEDVISSGEEVPEDDFVEIVVVEDEEVADMAELVSPEKEEEVTIAKPEALDEAVTIYAAEKVEGAGTQEKSLQVAKSRAKRDEGNTLEEAVIFSQVEQMPEFPGGMDSLYYFLQQHLIYPGGNDQQVDTTVIAEFIINKKGKIKNIAILKSAGKVYDDEVVRVIKKMPAWAPATQGGKAVSAKYTLPVQFKTE